MSPSVILGAHRMCGKGPKGLPTAGALARSHLGRKDVRTIMIYTHVLNRGGKGVKSPVDDL